MFLKGDVGVMAKGQTPTRQQLTFGRTAEKLEGREPEQQGQQRLKNNEALGSPSLTRRVRETRRALRMLREGITPLFRRGLSELALMWKRGKTGLSLPVKTVVSVLAALLA